MGRSHAPKPVWLLAGGPGSHRRGPDPLIQRALSLAGKPSPSVAYVGAPSGDSRSCNSRSKTILAYSLASSTFAIRSRSPDSSIARSKCRRPSSGCPPSAAGRSVSRTPR